MSCWIIRVLKKSIIFCYSFTYKFEDNKIQLWSTDMCDSHYCSQPAKWNWKSPKGVIFFQRDKSLITRRGNIVHCDFEAGVALGLRIQCFPGCFFNVSPFITCTFICLLSLAVNTLNAQCRRNTKSSSAFIVLLFYNFKSKYFK